MDDKFIDFSIAPYCLAQLLLALYNSGLRDFAITLEDNDLHVRINKRLVENVVYGYESSHENATNCIDK